MYSVELWLMVHYWTENAGAENEGKNFGENISM